MNMQLMNMQVVMNSMSAIRKQPVMTSTASLASCGGSYKSPQTQMLNLAIELGSADTRPNWHAM